MVLTLAANDSTDHHDHITPLHQETSRTLPPSALRAPVATDRDRAVPAWLTQLNGTRRKVARRHAFAPPGRLRAASARPPHPYNRSTPTTHAQYTHNSRPNASCRSVAGFSSSATGRIGIAADVTRARRPISLHNSQPGSATLITPSPHGTAAPCATSSRRNRTATPSAPPPRTAHQVQTLLSRKRGHPPTPAAAVAEPCASVP
jgi:hypothetical protein